MSDKPLHVVYGDWRDLRAALEKADPTLFTDKSAADRIRIYKAAEMFIEHYTPLRGQCANCREVMSWQQIYRCADCDAAFCKPCIKQHFGPQHKPHPTQPFSLRCSADANRKAQDRWHLERKGKNQ